MGLPHDRVQLVEVTNDVYRRVDLIGMKLAVFPEVRVLKRQREILEADAFGGGERRVQRERLA